MENDGELRRRVESIRLSFEQDKELQEQLEAITRSEQLTAEDLSLVINVRA